MDSSSINCAVKQPMTDAERLELSKRLDDDLENFINSVEKRKYTEGWPEDRWEEEMEQHPFFMKNAPEPGEKLNPLMEGLQQLKYDPNENTPEELANAYKDDGNFNFKHKNYRLAIIAYTEGIKIKSDNTTIQSTLYNNRSAAHYYLQNYRSSLKDAQLALRLTPDYEKAQIRAAHCYYEIECYEDAIKLCDLILSKNGLNEEISQLRLKSISANKAKERDLRRKKANEGKALQAEQELVEAILKSGVRIDRVDGNSLKLNHLQPAVPQLERHTVHLDKDGKLAWPVILTYPEYRVMDFLQQFNEDDTFEEHLHQILAQRPEWDTDKKYDISTISVYVELINTKLCKIDVSRTLREVLRLEGCVVKCGTPSFIVVVSKSPFEKQLLKECALDGS